MTAPRRGSAIGLVLGLGLTMTACQSDGALLGAGGASATVLARNTLSRCPLSSGADVEGVQVLDRAEDWTARVVGASESDVFHSPVDWAAQRIVVITMGSQPTGGYALSMPQTQLPVRDGVLEMVVERQRPAADAMVTQAFTTPCLFVQVRRMGWSRVSLSFKD